jgi:flagellar biosynthesis/type III secretory pathway ATPase
LTNRLTNQALAAGNDAEDSSDQRTGVRAVVDGVSKDIKAEREVILAAGGVGSPTY